MKSANASCSARSAQSLGDSYMHADTANELLPAEKFAIRTDTPCLPGIEHEAFTIWQSRAVFFSLMSQSFSRFCCPC